MILQHTNFLHSYIRQICRKNSVFNVFLGTLIISQVFNSKTAIQHSEN